MPVETQPITVVCVDDNQNVLDALAIRLRLEPDVSLLNLLTAADGLLACVDQLKPRVVILDIDMPGLSPFDVIIALASEHGNTRVVVFSGDVTPSTIDRAVESGAWGYVSKTDGEDVLLAAIRSVALGHFVLSPEARVAMGHSG